MPSRPIRLTLVLLLTGALVVGCSPEPREPGGVPSVAQISDWGTNLDRMLTIGDVALLSQPEIVGEDVVAAYVADDQGDVYLRGWDLASRDLLWARRVVPGLDSEKLEMNVEWQYVDGRAVIGFIAAKNRDQWRRGGHPRIIDAKTGENLTPELNSVRVVGYRPTICDGEFCVGGVTVSGPVKEFTFSTENRGTFTEMPRGTMYRMQGGALLGDHIASRRTDGVETLEDNDKGEIVWTRPYKDIFGEDFDTRNGWAWASKYTKHPVIGIGYSRRDDFDRSVAQTITREYGAQRIVALDRASGETLWTQDRVSICAVSDDFVIADDVLVACRHNSGELSYDWDGTAISDARWKDMDVDMVGLDPKTGKAIWTLPLGEEPANYAWYREDGQRPFSLGGTLVATVDGRSHTVNPATGATTPFPDDARILCDADSEETIPLTGPEETETLVDYDLAAPKEMCGADGTPLKGKEIGRAAVEIAGYDLSRPIALNIKGDIVVFEAPEPKPRKAKGVRVIDKVPRASE